MFLNCNTYTCFQECYFIVLLIRDVPIYFIWIYLATQIWETADDKLNSMEFAEAIDNSDLEILGFSDDFIIELWGVITDVRSGRIRKSNWYPFDNRAYSKKLIYFSFLCLFKRQFFLFRLFIRDNWYRFYY